VALGTAACRRSKILAAGGLAALVMAEDARFPITLHDHAARALIDETNVLAKPWSSKTSLQA
jgi:hypothetical protein